MGPQTTEFASRNVAASGSQSSAPAARISPRRHQLGEAVHPGRLDREPLVDKRSIEPKDVFISKLVVEHLRSSHVEKSDAVRVAFLLVVSGNATMVEMIALASPSQTIKAGEGIIASHQSGNRDVDVIPDPVVLSHAGTRTTRWVSASGRTGVNR
ncbi:cytochrome P450 55A1 [Colletotrichum graminicola]|nr:cytochrome P450 55A1 [Colletotrichum graminicola]